jgi:predicted metal-dependent hydrolase
MPQLTFNGLIVDVTPKKIKGMRLVVAAPEGRVRLSVPLRTTENAMRNMLQQHWTWIQQKQAAYQALPRPSTFTFTDGELHPFLGRLYPLKIVHTSKRSKVLLEEGVLEMHVAATSSVFQRTAVLTRWYRAELQKLLPPMIAEWEQVIGVKTSGFTIRHVKSRWGSCNIHTRQIMLNLELMKKPLHCLEYVVVHELVHLLEASHNARFKGLMDRFLPPWREYQKELNGRLL